MKKTVIAISILLVSSFFFPALSFSEEFQKNGFNIDIHWKQMHNRELKVWGEIEGNKNCKQVNISISFDNTKKSTAIGWVETFIKNYRKGSTRRFKVTDGVNAKSYMKKHWFIDSIYIKCL